MLEPAVLLLLLLGAIQPQSSEAEISRGLNFLVVFPENVAYFYPEGPQNQVQVTALYRDTHVTVNISSQVQSRTLSAAETQRFFFYRQDELRRKHVSNRVVQVSSTKVIVVQALSLKADSVQSALVLPTERLGTDYLIPPIPRIQGTTDPADAVSVNVTERGPFRLVVVNADKQNKVMLEGDVIAESELEPYHAAQFWLTVDDAWTVLRVQHPAAVLFSHTCAMIHNCSCSLLYATLPPATQQRKTFFIPMALSRNQTSLFLSQEELSTIEDLDPDTPLVEITGNALLHRPGMLLPLIPEADFASCYVVTAIPSIQNSAVIVVHKDLTDGVHVGRDAAENAAWEQLKGTDHVSTVVELTSDTAIWHSSHKIAVYYMGERGGALFGNPAPAVSQTSADPRGCVLSPDILEVGQEAVSWQESVKYCRGKNLQLVSLSTLPLQNYVHAKVQQLQDVDLRRAWIGLRRSWLTGEWYWLNMAPVTVTSWKGAQPSGAQGSQCGTVSLEPGQDFSWNDEDCCQPVRPICYRGPVLFPVE
ncbi:IgGFc-binding protein isoform X1 [Entelurus aequoreus]|uniref:IgGFc-binding protein isoform X1 n=1 Tax=Entelurus aequoreus TaxID=161455 RepID=UPI002B1DF55D|nr:IgGFc-binding protein isoform X1 [Entelurus aequoreus]XP_061884853.1 IgGFc-binding protein isoform X1 [Entelurus aequoreus]